MAPIGGIIIGIAAVCVVAPCAAAILVIGVRLFWRGRAAEHLGKQFLGAALISAVLTTAVLAIAGPWLQPLGVHAKDYVRLPPQARVVRVDDGDWSGDGVVVFTLPPSRTVPQWLDMIWQMNAPSDSDTSAFTKTPLARRWQGSGVAHQELTYDPRKHLFYFDVMGDS